MKTGRPGSLVECSGEASSIKVGCHSTSMSKSRTGAGDLNHLRRALRGSFSINSILWQMQRKLLKELDPGSVDAHPGRMSPRSLPTTPQLRDNVFWDTCRAWPWPQGMAAAGLSKPGPAQHPNFSAAHCGWQKLEVLDPLLYHTMMSVKSGMKKATPHLYLFCTQKSKAGRRSPCWASGFGVPEGPELAHDPAGVFWGLAGLDVPAGRLGTKAHA